MVIHTAEQWFSRLPTLSPLHLHLSFKPEILEHILWLHQMSEQSTVEFKQKPIEVQRQALNI